MTETSTLMTTTLRCTRTIDPGPAAASPHADLRAFGRCTSALVVASLLLINSGCATRESTFRITDYREPGEARRYQETFDEAYYDLDGEGNMDIVLRRIEPTSTDPTLDITQVIHLRTVWNSIPGRTVAERTQINGTVSYVIVHGRTGAAFEGAGAVFFKQNRRKDILKGSLDQARLKPTRTLAEDGDLFQHAELTGEFRATRDRRKVVRIVNDMNRLFGPLPPR